MNTPTHAVLNVALLARGRRRALAAPVVAGAVAPDVPIYVLFLVATFVWREPQREIWAVTYFEPGWQHAVDALHSFPVLGAALALTYLPVQAAAPALPWLRAALASALLHAGVDLLVHVEDAHHHLWPLSDWQFRSAVSYWDPRHHGRIFAPLECLAVLLLMPTTWRAARSRAARVALGALAAAYGVGFVAGVARLRAGPDAGAGAGSLQGAVTGRH